MIFKVFYLIFKEQNLKPWEPSEKGNSWIVEKTHSNSEENDEDENDDSDSEVEVVKQVTIEDRVIDNIGMLLIHHYWYNNLVFALNFINIYLSSLCGIFQHHRY